MAESETGAAIPVDEMLDRIEALTRIGAALSSDHDIEHLLKFILTSAKELLKADGGTIYRVQGDEVVFAFLVNDTLKISMWDGVDEERSFPPIRLYDAKGNPNNAMVVAYSILHDTTVNIRDAYVEQGFDFSGTKLFDRQMGYRSKSFLTVPMKNHENQIIGVLQLLNAQNAETGEVIPFTSSDQKLAEAIASQAAVSLTNTQLIDQLKALFYAFVRVINRAIDDKSTYTGGHCQRVPQLALMLADAVNETSYGPLKDFVMTEKDRLELELAGLLHDCGKITTPVHVVDKRTKLETICDKISLIETRFAVLKSEAKLALLESCVANPAEREVFGSLHEEKIRAMDEDLAFLRRINIGAEFLKEEDFVRVGDIARRYSWTNEKGDLCPVLDDAEIENLTIRMGTLNGSERKIINHHADMTIAMLNDLPWPRELSHVTEYAGGHHERVDGKGYPNGLRGDQMSVQARMMGIADIFEALTAKDRPYKKVITLSESLIILGKMCLEGHVDADLFDIFVRKQVYMRYAEKYLDAAQIDAVDQKKIPGYRPD